MGKTAVGLYGTAAEAKEVVRDLVAAGFARNTIRLFVGDQSSRLLSEWNDDAGMTATAGGYGSTAYGATGYGSTTSSGAAAYGRTGTDTSGYGANAAHGSAGASSTLTAAGVPAADAHNYEEALHRGSALVSISTSDDRINDAVEVMSRYSILDIHEHMRSWGAGVETDGNGYGRTTGTLDANEEAAIPVIEEEVRVGKREVERGGVRVRAHVTETPVEETVTLRDEHVSVERRPVDRAVSSADANALRDQTIEVTEHDEEVVIDKQARVVEEVVVRKDVETRQETVTDTVRRTDVEVEQVGRTQTGGWERWSDDFNRHYTTTFGSTGRSFRDYEPAYRYGYSLGDRTEWRGRAWNDIEADVRRDWDARNQGPWEDFKDAVRYAWNRVTRP